VHHHWLGIEKPARCSAACERKCFVVATIDESKFSNKLDKTGPSGVGSKGGVDGHRQTVGTIGNELSFRRG
jgi:hypothetical protein